MVFVQVEGHPGRADSADHLFIGLAILFHLHDFIERDEAVVIQVGSRDSGIVFTGFAGCRRAMRVTIFFVEWAGLFADHIPASRANCAADDRAESAILRYRSAYCRSGRAANHSALLT